MYMITHYTTKSNLASSLAKLVIKHLPFKNCEINYVLFFQCHIFTTTSMSFHGENHLNLEAYFEWCRTSHSLPQHQWFPLKKFQPTNRHLQHVCLIGAKTYTLINDYPKEQIAAPRWIPITSSITTSNVSIVSGHTTEVLAYLRQ